MSDLKAAQNPQEGQVPMEGVESGSAQRIDGNAIAA